MSSVYISCRYAQSADKTGSVQNQHGLPEPGVGKHCIQHVQQKDSSAQQLCRAVQVPMDIPVSMHQKLSVAAVQDASQQVSLSFEGTSQCNCSGCTDSSHQFKCSTCGLRHQKCGPQALRLLDVSRSHPAIGQLRMSDLVSCRLLKIYELSFSGAG